LNATPTIGATTAKGMDRLQQQGSPNGEGPGRQGLDRILYSRQASDKHFAIGVFLYGRASPEA
jgi:hypothetical protein